LLESHTIEENRGGVGEFERNGDMNKGWGKNWLEGNPGIIMGRNQLALNTKC
jgi:hypothetical protein